MKFLSLLGLAALIHCASAACDNGDNDENKENFEAPPQAGGALPPPLDISAVKDNVLGGLDSPRDEPTPTKTQLLLNKFKLGIDNRYVTQMQILTAMDKENGLPVNVGVYRLRILSDDIYHQDNQDPQLLPLRKLIKTLEGKVEATRNSFSNDTHCPICNPGNRLNLRNPRDEIPYGQPNYCPRCFGVGIVDEMLLLSCTDDRFPIPRKWAASMSIYVNHIVDFCDTTTTRLVFEDITTPILFLIVQYIKHHKGNDPAKILKPINSDQMKDLMLESKGLKLDPWDAHVINQEWTLLTPQEFPRLPGMMQLLGDQFSREQTFDLIKAANRLGVRRLVQLGIAKIATIVKTMSPEKIKKILEDELDEGTANAVMTLTAGDDDDAKANEDN